MKKKKLIFCLSLFSSVAIAATVLFGSRAGKTLIAGAEKEDYVLTIDGSCFDSSLNETPLMNNPRTLSTSNGNPITITSSNALCLFANHKWDSSWAFYNGVQADAEFHNATPLNGIRKIEFDIRWNMFTYAGTEEDVVNITVSSDKDFSENVYKVKVVEKAAVQENADESFSLNFDGSAAYFKFDFGTSTTGKNRHQYCCLKKMKIYYSCSSLVEKHLILNDKNHLADGTYDPSATEVHSFKASDDSDIDLSMFRAYYMGDGFYKTGGYATTDVHNETALSQITRAAIEIKWNTVDNVPLKFSNNSDFSDAKSITLTKDQGVSVRDTYYETFYLDLSASKPSYFKFLSDGWSEYALISVDFAYVG